MPVQSLELRSVELTTSKLRTLDLVRALNLEKLHLHGNYYLVELHMPVESLKLKTLEIDCSKLRTLDLSRTPNLELLEIAECHRFEKLQLQADCSLRCLRELTLSGSFPELPEDLHQLECLEMLLLSSKKIKHLPNSICKLKHLKVLNVTDCYRVPSSICMLKHLKGLGAKWLFYEPTLLEHLPEDIGRLQNLVELYLSSKMIKHIPKSICMLKHLKVLILKNCYLLEKLPEDLGRLECLETLDLGNCIFLREIPSSMCEMKHLNALILSYCFLVEKLPEELGLLKCLKWLYIEGGGITHLPQSIFQLKGLYINGSSWWLESYGLKSITELPYSRYSAQCYI